MIVRHWACLLLEVTQGPRQCSGQPCSPVLGHILSSLSQEQIRTSTDCGVYAHSYGGQLPIATRTSSRPAEFSPSHGVLCGGYPGGTSPRSWPGKCLRSVDHRTCIGGDDFLGHTRCGSFNEDLRSSTSFIPNSLCSKFWTSLPSQPYAFRRLKIRPEDPLKSGLHIAWLRTFGSMRWCGQCGG